MQNLKTKSAELICTETKKIVVKNGKKKPSSLFPKNRFLSRLEESVTLI